MEASILIEALKQKIELEGDGKVSVMTSLGRYTDDPNDIITEEWSNMLLALN